MSDHDDHEVLDEDRSPRSNGSHSPRPAGRSPSRSRSRSRSPPARRTGGGGRGGNSRSRSRSPGRRYSGRARSPVARRRSHYNGSGGGAGGGHSSVNRENPAPSRCLGIFGLSMYTEEHEIRELFGRYGRIEEVKIVYDAQTARSRGFGFVYFDSDVDAAEAKERCNGINLGGRDIRVDFSVTQRAHTPTPGIYMGKKSRQSGGGGGGGGGGRGGFRRDGGDRSDRGYDRGGSGYGRSRDGGYGGGDRNGGGGGYGDRSGGYGGGDRGGFDRRRSPVGGASSYGRRSGGGGMRYSRSRSRSPPRQRHYR